MPLVAVTSRHVWSTRNIILRQKLRRIPSIVPPRRPRRCFSSGGQSLVVEEAVAEYDRSGHLGKFIEEYKTSFNVPRHNFVFNKAISLSQIGKTITAVGFVGKRRNIGKTMTFVPLYGGSTLEQVQIFARSEINDEARKTLREIPENSAVSVTGVLDYKYEEKTRKEEQVERQEGQCLINEVEIRVQRIDCLGTFPDHLKRQPDQQFDAKYRHLQIRFDKQLRERLEFRSRVAAFARNSLSDFQEVETPILFKSTPEGAREFIVPTRRKGHAYGLPQSPQQYKQVLMASGIHRYVQFAKCFRDEDHRADRQPEFTQIDLEMAWADGEDVMQRVESFMKDLWREFAKPGTVIGSPLPDLKFPRMTYNEAMSKHGSDKPDLRIKHLIHRVDHIIPPNLRGMLTSVENPIIEACKVRLGGGTAAVQKFVRGFMDSPDAEEFRSNVAGAPGIFIVDLRRPLEGLQAFGFEGAEALRSFYQDTQHFDSEFEEGDFLLLQARENLPHTGGSTMLGRLRLAVHKAALSQGLVEPDPSHHFLWVTDFPMFTANDGSEPGQEGDSGFSATHHPFTAPKTASDVDLLLTSPLKAIADHYDLVLNGVELGGGSRRIHNAEMQKFVMGAILKMNAKRIHDFSHLFLALEAGCPPHAGLAIGFDRLIAVMQGRDSVRDVIAFPKDKNGTDLMVNSPSKLSKLRMAEYHLQIKGDQADAVAAEARDIEAHKAASLESLKILLDTIAGCSTTPSGNGGPLVGPAARFKQQDDGPAETITQQVGAKEATSDKSTEGEIESGEGTDGEALEEEPPEALFKYVPRYTPGELLPYAVMLYHQIGGNFLHETLKGFETLIESLGKDCLGSTTKLKEQDSTALDIPQSSPTERLEKLHGQLMNDILRQMHNMEVMNKTSGSTPTLEDLREQLEDAVEPVKMLRLSLKALEPMLETLNAELDKRIHEYTTHLDHEQAATQQPSSKHQSSP